MGPRERLLRAGARCFFFFCFFGLRLSSPLRDTAKWPGTAGSPGFEPSCLNCNKLFGCFRDPLDRAPLVVLNLTWWSHFTCLCFFFFAGGGGEGVGFFWASRAGVPLWRAECGGLPHQRHLDQLRAAGCHGARWPRVHGEVVGSAQGAGGPAGRSFLARHACPPFPPRTCVSVPLFLRIPPPLRVRGRVPKFLPRLGFSWPKAQGGENFLFSALWKAARQVF